MKKVLGFVLVAAVLVAAFPVSANAAGVIGVKSCIGSKSSPCVMPPSTTGTGGNTSGLNHRGGGSGSGATAGGGGRNMPPAPAGK